MEAILQVFPVGKCWGACFLHSRLVNWIQSHGQAYVATLGKVRQATYLENIYIVPALKNKEQLKFPNVTFQSSAAIHQFVTWSLVCHNSVTHPETVTNRFERTPGPPASARFLGSGEQSEHEQSVMSSHVLNVFIVRAWFHVLQTWQPFLQ